MITQSLLFSVVGQTATGKTKRALELAELLLVKQRATEVWLVSADSKQVFQGLEVLSGADIPAGFAPQRTTLPLPFFANAPNTIQLHGVACVAGDAEWSVAHFQRLFAELHNVATTDTAVIVVGGTGLYHQQLFAPADTLFIPPNEALRGQLQRESVSALQKAVRQSWPERWQAMSYSDRYNPRRLIRAIEVSLSAANTQTPKTQHQKPHTQFGLQLSNEELRHNIAARIDRRIEQGAIQEVGAFELQYPDRAVQAKYTLGYNEILEYLLQRLSLDELKTAWATAEYQYAKQQHTWWKKQLEVKWQEADTPLNIA